MAQGTNIPWDGIANPHRISQDIEDETILASGWSVFFRENNVTVNGVQVHAFVGDVGQGGRGNSDPNRSADFSGSIIETWSDLQNGGTTVDVPRILELVKDPTSGNSTMTKTGEGRRFLWQTYHVGVYKKVYQFLTEQDEQALMDSMKNKVQNDAKPALARYRMRWTHNDINFAMLTGLSANQSNLRGIKGARTDNGTPHSPGNFYVAGKNRGLVPYGQSDRPATEAYESRLKAWLNAMMNEPVADNTLTAARFRTMRVWHARRGGQKMNVGGKNLFVCVMNDQCAAALENDLTLRKEVYESFPRDPAQSPLFADIRLIYAQTAIYVFSGNLFGVQFSNNSVVLQSNSTLGIPAYGPSGPWIPQLGIEATDTNDCCLIYWLSPNILAKTKARLTTKLTLQNLDHEQEKELGMRWWESYSRTDVRDADGILGYGDDVWAQHPGFMVAAVNCPYVLET